MILYLNIIIENYGSVTIYVVAREGGRGSGKYYGKEKIYFTNFGEDFFQRLHWGVVAKRVLKFYYVGCTWSPFIEFIHLYNFSNCKLWVSSTISSLNLIFRSWHKTVCYIIIKPSIQEQFYNNILMSEEYSSMDWLHTARKFDIAAQSMGILEGSKYLGKLADLKYYRAVTRSMDVFSHRQFFIYNCHLLNTFGSSKLL